jgi:hypothetical protein
MQVSRSSSSGSSLLVALVCALALCAAACGSAGTTSDSTSAKTQNASSGSGSSSSSASTSCVDPNVKKVHFTKLKFAGAAGGSAFLFHRYILQPLRAGSFKAGLKGRKATITKAALASAGIALALKKMHDYMMSDDVLCKGNKLFTPFSTAATTLAAKLKKGDTGEGAITDTNTALTQLQNQLGFKDHPVPLPGA